MTLLSGGLSVMSHVSAVGVMAATHELIYGRKIVVSIQTVRPRSHTLVAGLLARATKPDVG